MDTVEQPDEDIVAEELTDRQAECLRLTGDGMSSKEIGRMLGISPSTVDNHIHAAVAKLHARNRWHAAKLLHPNRTEKTQESIDKARFLPPIGGKSNKEPAKRRFLQIISICFVAIIVMAAIGASIIAAIYVSSFF